MGILILLQLVFDVAVVGAAVWLFLNKREWLMASSETSTEAFEQWKKDWELEKQNQAQQLAVQLRSIRLLFEQTKKLVDEKANAFSAFPVSQEENELKHLVLEKNPPMIPTLIEFEAQKNRLKQETPLDLKSLLAEQLC